MLSMSQPIKSALIAVEHLRLILSMREKITLCQRAVYTPFFKLTKQNVNNSYSFKLSC